MSVALRNGTAPEGYVIALPAPDDFAFWRERARALVQAAVPPDRVTWSEPGEARANLFARDAITPPAPSSDAPAPRSSRAFLQLAQSAILHSDAERLDLLYRLLWRLQGNPRLIEDAADRDVRRLEVLAKAVRRDIHKMRAFVRFRSVDDGDAEHFVAWFEPEHHILRANAKFFVNRFANMAWSILTPKGSLHWDGAAMAEGPPAQRCDAPAGDPAEELWLKYYASTFNPARLKVNAMVKEMPRRYWKNLPEAALIPELIAGAQARESVMVDRGASLFEDAAPLDLAQIASGIAACQRCAIGCNGTRAVMGEGAAGARLMIVGEQPGDVEEELSRPFVGPAGRLLRAHLAEAGIDAAAAYVTNAVKHFKHTPQGKRRLHQTPTAGEIDVCRWWVEAERAIVKPRLVLALGASAARSLLGRTVSVQKVRGQPQRLEDEAELWITTHPSYLLRLDDTAREVEEQRFAEDLRAVAARLALI